MVAEMSAQPARGTHSDPAIARVEVVAVHGMGMQHSSETLLEWAEPILQRIDFYAKQAPSHPEPAGSQLPPVIVALETEEIDAVDLDSREWFDKQRVTDDRTWRVARELGIQLGRRAKNMSSAPEAGGDELTGTARIVVEDATNPLEDDDQIEPSEVEFTSVVVGAGADDHVAAQVRYVIPGAQDDHRLLSVTFTEARWAESLLPLSRSRVFTWGIYFLWKAVGRVALYLRNMVYGTARAVSRPLGWLSWVVIGSSVAALIVLGAITTVLLVLVGPLMLLPGVATKLGPTIDTFVGFIGDVPSWSEHPVRAAAMRAIVLTQIQQARNRAGDDGTVVVIAHSEGAAITVELLCQPSPPTAARVDVLVTVGAAVTLLGRPGWTRTNIRAPELVSTGRSDELNLVRSWAKRELPMRWLNFWATWDVVPSGPISTGAIARRARWSASYSSATSAQLGPEEHPVHNRSSPLEDHQTYSANVVQVIDPLTRMIMNPVPRLADTLHLTSEQAAWNRAHVIGVKRLGFNRLLIAILGVLAVLDRDVYASFVAIPLGGIASAIAAAFDLDTKAWPWSWVLSQNWLTFVVAVLIVLALLVWANSVLLEKCIDSVLVKNGPAKALPPHRWFIAGLSYALLSVIALLTLTAAGLLTQWSAWVFAVVGVAVVGFFPRVGGAPPGTPQVVNPVPSNHAHRAARSSAAPIQRG
jgi:hypothetical protein